MEDFSRKMIDPELYSLNGLIRNIIKTFSLRLCLKNRESCSK